MTTSTKFTPGPWVAKPMGGASTVLCDKRPRHNDLGSPTYGYAENGAYCVARTFSDDLGVRRDFVVFSHEDALLIAAAPELYDVAEAALYLANLGSDDPVLVDFRNKARAALAKARGEA